MKKLLLADGSNIMFRSFYAIRPFTTKDGLHTNAVYGLATTLSRHIDAIKPDGVAVAFDLPAPTFRHERYAEYKGTRRPTPAELVEQLPYIKRCAAAMGATVLEVPGFEADDLLGSLAADGEREGYLVYVLTGDRDALQLITENVSVILLTNKEDIIYTPERFREEYGTEPARLVDIKALMGDASDNIPGVPGIGKTTALKLVSTVGGIDVIYNSIDTLPASESVKKKLLDGRELAFMSAELAKIRRDAPVGITARELGSSYKGMDKASLRTLFAELEFHRLTERFGLIEKDNKEDTSSENAACVSVSVSDKPPEILPLDEKTARTIKKAAVALDTGKDKLIIKTEDAVYEADIASTAAADLLTGDTEIYCHDYKALYALLRDKNEHISKVNCAFDTMLAAYVLRPGEGSYDLSRVATAYLGETKDISTPLDKADTIFRLTSPMREAFAKVDAEAGELGLPPLSRVLYDIEMPLSPVLADMEKVGFKIDRDGLLKYTKLLATEEERIAARIYERAGHEFNINSPKQLGNVLFAELGLPSGKKTKTGYSTDAETLEKLRYDYAIVEDVLEYRQLAKLRSTYGEGLANAADESGRIHTSFKQTVTATGRLSSNEPNLQNIPVRTELGRELRRYFIPEDGYVLLDADYSQIELRLLAAISGDETMMQAFLRGADIHTATAAEVFGVPEESVTRELRSRAKAVNFGIVYGIGEFSLARDIGTSRKVAAEYIENYLATYPKINAYLKKTVEDARIRGYVTTLLGRRRYIPELYVSNKATRAFGERVAMNSPIQGSAADIIKLAMINTARALQREGLDARLILQVHDELIVEAKRECAAQAAAVLRREMENAILLSVPLSVEVTEGVNWYECK